jgi:hypothetical protein
VSTKNIGSFAALSSEASFEPGGSATAASFGHEGHVVIGKRRGVDFLGIPGLLRAGPGP